MGGRECDTLAELSLRRKADINWVKKGKNARKKKQNVQKHGSVKDYNACGKL